MQGKRLALLRRRCRPGLAFLLLVSRRGSPPPPPRGGAEMIQFHLGPIGLVSNAPVKVRDRQACLIKARCGRRQAL